MGCQMISIGQGLLTAGMGVGVYAVLMDTTVMSQQGNRVYSADLMQQQNTLLWVAGVAVVAGLILLLKDRTPPDDAQNGTPQTRTRVRPQYVQALRLIRADDANGLRALLRQSEAVVQGEDEHRQTLLHHAAAAQSLACVCVLLQHGASPSRVDAAGKRPADYAALDGAGVGVRAALRAAG